MRSLVPTSDRPTVATRAPGGYGSAVTQRAEVQRLTVLAGQVGNRAMVQRLRTGPVLQRLARVYTFADLGKGSPTPNWSDELQGPVGRVAFSREGIPTAVQGHVDGYKDGNGAGPYRHHVPYALISRALIHKMEEGTLAKAIKMLTFLHDDLHREVLKTGVNIGRYPPGNDPARNRAEYDYFVDWHMQAICDCPIDIFRFEPSSGDHGGTALDQPKGASGALDKRLANALLWYKHHKLDGG